MPITAIKFGRVLILVGIIGYGFGYFNGRASLTAFIPAAFGLILIVLGYIAQRRENMRKHMMHIAVVIGLLGFLAAAGRLISKISEITFSAAYVSQIMMALICFIFVVLSVRSFVNARSIE